MTGQSATINGKYYYRNENGNPVAIALDRKLVEPKLTGNTELDKKRMSSYSADITAKINDIVKLNEQRVDGFSDTEAEKKITELQALQKSIKAKATTPKVKKVKAIKLKLPKSKVIKVKSIKPKKIKVYKLSKSKKLVTKIPKVTIPKV